jgi:hypothetical protein
MQRLRLSADLQRPGALIYRCPLRQVLRLRQR